MELEILQQVKELESLFISDTKSAIIECQKIICKSACFDSYNQFYSYHLQHPHISTCQKEWKEDRMSIHCFDCSLNTNSCICLQCFLNGDHKGHNYSICPETVGNCDCGDTNLWKRTGFCIHHKGLAETDNSPEYYLDVTLRTTLTDLVFKSAFLALAKLPKSQDQIASEIFQFINSFLDFGDGFRRLIAISLTEKIDFSNLLNHVTDYSFQFNQLFQKLCGNLINDQIFIRNFSKVTYLVVLDYVKVNGEDEIHKFWSDFFYHSFSPQPIRFNISHNHWDWIEFMIQFLTEAKEIFKFVGNEEASPTYPQFCFSLIQGISYATSFQPNEETQKFFDRLITEVLTSGSRDAPNNDSIIPVSFRNYTDKNFYLAAKNFMYLFYLLFNCFKFKRNLNFDVLIENLEKNIDVSPIYNYNINDNENDKFISLFMKNKNNDNDEMLVFPFFFYDSFHNGASFFFSLPLYDSFVNIFGLENLCKIKIARLLWNEKHQNLRIKLAIVTLKKILSFVCYGQSLTPKNFGLIQMINYDVEDANNATFSISRYLPVFQLLIGLQCCNEKIEFSLKEFFAFEMAKEIGLFDDFDSEDYKDEDINETKNKMHFSFLYLSLLLVVERILFNFDSNEFIREQLIFALKSGQSDINELNKSYDRRVLDDFENPINFNSVLFNIASIKTRKVSGSENNNEKEDISFVLKDDVKMNTISAIVPIKKQKSILNNEISKHPDKLINVQDFEPEETYYFNTTIFSPSSLTTRTYCSKSQITDNEQADYSGLNIRLKEFLITPTVLAVVYHSLRMNYEFKSSHIDLNDHLSLNILILISKFIKEKNDCNSKSLPIESINYDSIHDLIAKFRTAVFDYKIESNNENGIESATIDNSFNFNSFLNLKISYKNKLPMSFIDLIHHKGEIGKYSLNKLSIESITENESSNIKKEEEDKIIKKQRANRLKEEIMNKYKNMISNYKMNDEYNENNSCNLHEQIDSNSSNNLLSFTPSCSGVINGTDVCSICSSIKKNENLSYPLFIYQTKFPFIVDKPPLNKGKENEISVSCDDDVDFDTEEEEEEQNENFQHEEEEDLNELSQIEMQIQSLNLMFQKFLAERNNSGSMNDESTASAFAAFQRISQEIMVRKEITENRIFFRKLRIKKKEMKKQNQLKRIDDNKTNKRFTAGANFVVQFSLCQHVIHPSCVENDTFKCPIDRTLKNGFLPCLEFSSLNSLSDNEKESIEVFLSCYRKMIVPIKSRKVDIFTELIKSLSGLIVTHEIRLRSLPDCLDSDNTKRLARNLFLTTWLAYRIKGKPPITDTKPYNNTVNDCEVESRLTLFQRFIKKLIESDEIEEDDKKESSFKFIVDLFISIQKVDDKRSELIEKEIVLFLRRVCLADYFLLGKNDLNGNDDGYYRHNKLIEWDEVLSIENISKQFNFNFNFLKEEEIEFKPFVFSKLPKEFLHFALEPFNFPVDLTQEFTIFNLIDYNYLIENYDEFGESKNEEKIETKKAVTLKKSEIKLFLTLNYNLKHYPSALLLIGKFASRIILVVNDFTSHLRPFYLDKYGSPDFGFNRGEPLFLNEERYERFIDEVLSGNFSNNI